MFDLTGMRLISMCLKNDDTCFASRKNHWRDRLGRVFHESLYEIKTGIWFSSFREDSDHRQSYNLDHYPVCLVGSKGEFDCPCCDSLSRINPSP